MTSTREREITSDEAVAIEATGIPPAPSDPSAYDADGKPLPAVPDNPGLDPVGDVAYRYLGGKDGRHIAGIPRRDLTEAEFEALDPALKRDVALPAPDGSYLYEPAKKGKKS